MLPMVRPLDESSLLNANSERYNRTGRYDRLGWRLVAPTSLEKHIAGHDCG